MHPTRWTDEKFWRGSRSATSRQWRRVAPAGSPTLTHRRPTHARAGQAPQAPTRTCRPSPIRRRPAAPAGPGQDPDRDKDKDKDKNDSELRRPRRGSQVPSEKQELAAD